MQNMTCPIETGYTYEGLFICGGLQCGKTQNQKPSQFCQEWSNCAYHGIHWWLISPSIGQSPFMAGEPPLIRDGLYPVDSQLTKWWDLIILIEYLELSGHIDGTPIMCPQTFWNSMGANSNYIRTSVFLRRNHRWWQWLGALPWRDEFGCASKLISG